MLIKNALDVFVPAIPEQIYFPYSRECPPPAPPPRPPGSPPAPGLSGCYIQYTLQNVVTGAMAGAIEPVGTPPPYSGDPDWYIVSATEVCY